MDNSTLTTSPLSGPPAVGVATANASPEFVTAEGVRGLFGISKSTTLRLAADGSIRSVLLRRRGQKSGRRLFAVDSIRDHFRKLLAEQAAAASATN